MKLGTNNMEAGKGLQSCRVNNMEAGKGLQSCRVNFEYFNKLS